MSTTLPHKLEYQRNEVNMILILCWQGGKNLHRRARRSHFQHVLWRMQLMAHPGFACMRSQKRRRNGMRLAMNTYCRLIDAAAALFLSLAFFLYLCRSVAALADLFMLRIFHDNVIQRQLELTWICVYVRACSVYIFIYSSLGSHPRSRRERSVANPGNRDAHPRYFSRSFPLAHARCILCSASDTHTQAAAGDAQLNRSFHIFIHPSIVCLLFLRCISKHMANHERAVSFVCAAVAP